MLACNFRKLTAALLTALLVLSTVGINSVFAEANPYDYTLEVTGVEPNERNVYLLEQGDTFTIKFNLHRIANEKYQTNLFTSENISCDLTDENSFMYSCEALSDGPSVIYTYVYILYGQDNADETYIDKELIFFVGDIQSRSRSALSLFQTDPSLSYNRQNEYHYGEKSAMLDFISISPIPADSSDNNPKIILEELKFTCSPAKNSLIENVSLYRESTNGDGDIFIINGSMQMINGRQVFVFDVTGNERFIDSSTQYIVRGDIKSINADYQHNLDVSKSLNCGVRTEEDVVAFDRYSGMSLNTENGLVVGNFGYANSQIEFSYPRVHIGIYGPTSTPGLGGSAVQVDEPFFIEMHMSKDSYANINDLHIIIDYGGKTASAGRFYWKKHSEQTRYWRKDYETVEQIPGWGEEKIQLIDSTLRTEVYENGSRTIKFQLKSTDKLRTGYGFHHTIHAYATYNYGTWPIFVNFSEGSNAFIAFTKASADFEEPYGRILPDQPWEENYGSIRAEVSPEPVIIGQPTSTTFYVKTSSCINVNRLDYRNNYLVSGRGTMGSFYAGYDIKGKKVEGYEATTWGGEKVSFQGSEFSYNAETGECAVEFNWTPKAGFIVANNNSVTFYKRIFNPFTSALETSIAWEKLTTGVDSGNDGTFETSL